MSIYEIEGKARELKATGAVKIAIWFYSYLDEMEPYSIVIGPRDFDDKGNLTKFAINEIEVLLLLSDRVAIEKFC